MEQFGTEVPVLGPDFKKIIEASVVSWVLGPIIGRSMSKQVHHVWLQGPTHDGEIRGSIEVVFAVMKQIIEQIEYVELSTLGRRFRLRAGWVVEGAGQGD